MTIISPTAPPHIQLPLRMGTDPVCLQSLVHRNTQKACNDTIVPLVAQTVKKVPAVWETQDRGEWKSPLERLSREPHGQRRVVGKALDTVE